MITTIIEIIDGGGTINWILFVTAIVAINTALTKFIFLSGEIKKIESGSSLSSLQKSVQEEKNRSEKFFRNQLREIMLKKHLELAKGRTTLSAIVSIAPLLGLLGTVVGIVKTFESITNFGFGNPVILAEGISIALITTEAGLLVAFPAMLMSSKLSTKINKAEEQMAQRGEAILREVTYA